MTTFALQERAALADLLDAVGPDAPTLCGDWDTYDLAAHLITRERHPAASLGIILKPLAGYTEHVRTGLKKRPYAELVELLRSGPPTLSIFAIDSVDEATNTTEFFVHHEDVRRAQPGWTRRELPEDLEKSLWVKLKSGARLAVRKAPAGLTLVTTGGRSHEARSGSPSVTITGLPSELTLYCSGRQAIAKVEATGDPESIAALATAPFGY